MPTIPAGNFNPSSTTPSPLTGKPDEATLLMAAAEVAQRGGFNNPAPEVKNPRKTKILRVIK